MNSYDKFMENEWNEYISNNSGRSIKDMMVAGEDVCNGMCDGILHLTKVAWRALAGLERHLTNKL